MNPSIQFCGAAETVTGSRHVLRANGKTVLVDCGLFQGPPELRERNWAPFPVPPQKIDSIVITHAHLDHIGYLPRITAQGYGGPIFSTPATRALSRISLPDSGKLQEEEAHYLTRKGLTRHSPALPLYTEKQAYACLKQFEIVLYDQFHDLPGKLKWRFLPAGHILGSAFAEIYFESGERILMTGDLGRFGTPIIVDPTIIDFAEYLVIESTYGDRIHSNEDPETKLEAIIKDAWAKGSCIIVPSFSIGRTQELLYYLKQLQDADRIPRIPLFVDSPMASSATTMYLKFAEDQDVEMREGLRHDPGPLSPVGLHWVRDQEQSKALNSHPGPLMIISGSGMATGGRVIHHLLNRIADPTTIVLFTGYQAEGTLGRRILEKEPEVQILGRLVPVRARIEKLNSLSAHADQAEILRWLGGFKTPPKRTFIVHGEPPAQAALKARIEKDLGWNVVIPHHLQQFELQ